MSDPIEQYRATLAKLEKQRDEVNKRIAPLLKLKEEKAKQAAVLNDEAIALGREVDKMRGGGQAWLDLKKHIGALHKLLSSYPKSSE